MDGWNRWIDGRNRWIDGRNRNRGFWGGWMKIGWTCYEYEYDEYDIYNALYILKLDGD